LYVQKTEEYLQTQREAELAGSPSDSRKERITPAGSTTTQQSKHQHESVLPSIISANASVESQAIVQHVPVHYSSGSSILHPSASSKAPNQLPSNRLWGITDELCDEIDILDMETRERRWKDRAHIAHRKSLVQYRSEKKSHQFVDVEAEDLAIQEHMAKKKVEFDEAAKAGGESGDKLGQLQAGKVKDAIKKASTKTTRSKLRSLGDFVKGHAMRKIMMGWNLIEPRFAKSNYTKIVMMKDSNGLSFPQKVQVLPISTVLGIVCTPKVKVYSSELDEILTNIGCTPEEILLGKKIAAVRTLMGPKQGEGMNPYEVSELMKHLHNYLKVPEKSISMDELMDQVFSKDPAQREAEMKSIEKERDQMVVAMLEQKKQKEDRFKLLEGRRLRGIESFEETLKEIQFVRTPFTFRRSYMLEDLQKYCLRVIYLKEESEGVAELPMEHIMLIGPDYFPESYHNRIQEWIEQQRGDAGASESTKESKVSIAHSNVDEEELSDDDHSVDRTNAQALAEIDRLKDKKYCKIDLVGPPTYVNMLRKIVSYGRGFDGSSYRDVIEMLQAYCSIRIQCMYRGAKYRRKYFEARRRWRKKFAVIKKHHFGAWANLCKHLRLLKRHCWRKLKAWNWYYRCSYRKRDLFRACYWPFFVWRRETVKTSTLTHKVKFLCTRVYPTYVQLTHFRGWKKFIKYKVDIKNRANNYFHGLQRKAMRESLMYLHRIASEKKMLRRIWMKGGIVQLRRTLILRKSTPFQIWYAYTYYRKMVRNRSKTLAAPFRRLLYPTLEPKPGPDKAKRRQHLAALRQDRIKAIIMENRAVMRERKRIKEDKKKKTDDSSVASGASKRSKDGAAANQEPLDTNIDPQSKEYSNASKVVDLDGQERLEKYIELRNGHYFDWSCEPMDFDLDSDCDEMEDIPDTLLERYEEITQGGDDDDNSSQGDSSLFSGVNLNKKDETKKRWYDPLYGPEHMPRVRWIDNWVVDRVRNLQRGFVYSEIWAFYETANRFHRLGHRVFNNLKTFAVVNRNARLSANAYGMKQKRLVFNGFLRWMLRDAQSAGFSISDQTDGERLREAVRNIRWSKMLRRRELIQRIKEKNEQDPNHMPEEEEYWSDIEPEEVRKKTTRLKEIRRYQKWSQEYGSRSPSPRRNRHPTTTAATAARATTPKSAARKSRARIMALSGRSASSSPVNYTSPHPLSPPPTHSGSPLTVETQGADMHHGGPPSSGTGAVPPGSRSPEDTGKQGRKPSTAPKPTPTAAAAAGQHAKAATAAGQGKKATGADRKATTAVGAGKSHEGKGEVHNPKTPKLKRKLTASPVQTVEHHPQEVQLPQHKVEANNGLPNILNWDREDRNADNTLAENLLTYSRAIRQRALEASVESELVAGALTEAIQTRDSMVDEVMKSETAITEEAIDAEIAYSRTFKVDAARIMLDVLYHIRVAVLDNLLKVEMKKYFK
jgi:hypothetical protein